MGGGLHANLASGGSRGHRIGLYVGRVGGNDVLAHRGRGVGGRLRPQLLGLIWNIGRGLCVALLDRR